MKRDILEKPFDKDLVRTRQGSFGATLSYVEGAEYIKRLNEAFDGEWSFEIVEHRVLDREVIVLGRLSAGGVAKVAFGGAAVTKSSQTGENLNLADDLKAAATDSLKKASSLFGLGLHLYGDGQREEKNVNEAQASVSRPPRRLTDRQLNAIVAIGRSLGMSPDSLRQRSIDAFGAPPEELTKVDASTLIGELQQMTMKKAA